MTDWGLLQTDNNFGNALLQGVQVGQQLRSQRDQRERDKATDTAYRQMYAGDPNAPNALLQVDPRAAYEMRDSMQAAQQQKQAKARQQMETVTKLLSGVRDESSYQQARMAAEQMGIDMSKVPPSYDPNWVAVQSHIAKTILTEPQKLSTMAQQIAEAGYQPGTPEFHQQMMLGIEADRTKVFATQPGGGVAAYQPGEGAKYVIAPNDGTQPAGAPVAGAPQAAIDHLRQNPSLAAAFDEKYGPGAAQQVLGGAASNGGGTFPR